APRSEASDPEELAGARAPRRDGRADGAEVRPRPPLHPAGRPGRARRLPREARPRPPADGDDLMTQQTLRRRRGRALRKQARLRRDNPRAAAAYADLAAVFQPAIDSVREAWDRLRSGLRPLVHFIAALASRARPIIHNGRKYR